MLSRIWDIRLSMLFAGLAGAGFSCADTIGAGGVRATTAGTGIGVFILVFILAIVERALLKSGFHCGMAAAIAMTCIADHRALSGSIRMINRANTFIGAIFFAVGTLAHGMRFRPAPGSQPGAIERQCSADRWCRAQQHLA
jgi:hypothetical protein